MPPVYQTIIRTIFFSLFVVLFVLTGCHRRPGDDGSTCADCHHNLEPASATHVECVSCHGGDPDNSDQQASHLGMYGPKNPSGPQSWEHTCGQCHPYQLARVKASLMYTNTGMIKNIQATWEGQDPHLYGTLPESVFDATGVPLELKSVEHLDNLSGELYRKFCSLCHVGSESVGSWSSCHGAGCGACHFPHNDNATYQGNDKTVRGKWPHSASHKMENLPKNDVCVRCHNRSGRIALSYEGRNDGNNALVPTRKGEPGPDIISDERNVTRIQADIHHEKGLECIDCHTSRDIMGDGYAYENTYLQTEITCEDCHGSAKETPKVVAVQRENDEVLRESSHYPRRMNQADKMVLTAKGRKYSNVFLEKGKIWLQGKRDGKIHECKVITGTPEHTIVGHERLDCYACHSRSVAQCYGCHTKYDQTKMGTDFVKRTKTPVIDRSGRKVLDEYVTIFKKRQQLRFAPFFGHNTGARAIGCSECHANPTFLGFGQHVVTKNKFEATLLCEKAADKPLDGFLVLDNGKVRSFSAITREGSRPLTATEIKKVLAVNLCLVCHNDPKDKIYQKELDYDVLDDCIKRSTAGQR